MQTDILAPVVPLLDFNSKTMYILYIYIKITELRFKISQGNLAIVWNKQDFLAWLWHMSDKVIEKESIYFF